jgi:hypothetical protein
MSAMWRRSSFFTSLRIELTVELRLPHISRLPVFQILMRQDIPLGAQMCTDALLFQYLAAADDLFHPGEEGMHGFLFVSGSLRYHQLPESAPIQESTETPVSLGTWLCEAAIWCQWYHVGRCEALSPSQVVCVNSVKIIDKLRGKKSNMTSLALEYAQRFHQRLVSAMPPHSQYPSDIGVPSTVFCEIVASLSKKTQICIGKDALSYLES